MDIFYGLVWLAVIMLYGIPLLLTLSLVVASWIMPTGSKNNKWSQIRDGLLLILLGLIPGINVGIVYIFFDEYKDKHELFNKVIECTDCGILQYKGYAIRPKKDNNTYTKCHYCGSEHLRDTELDIAPLSVKFSFWGTIKHVEFLNKYRDEVVNQSNADLQIEQLEKYKKLQEKQLAKLKEEVKNDSNN